MRCPGCGLDADALTTEHIVPESLGGGLTTQAFCEPCNRDVFEPADRAVRNFAWVAECVGRLGVRGKRGRAAKPRPIVADIDGSRIALRPGPDGLVPLEHPFSVSDRELVIPASFMEAFRARAEARDETISVTARIDMAEMTDDELQATISYPPDLWPRFAAKVALGLATIVCESGWFDSPAAEKLRAIVRAPKGEWIVVDGEAIPAVPVRLDSDSPERQLVAPEHVVRLGRADDGAAAVSILLFGEIRYAMRLPGELQLRNGLDLTDGLHWFVPLERPAIRAPQTPIELASQLMVSRSLDDQPGDQRANPSWRPNMRRAVELVFAAGYLRLAPSEEAE